MNKRPKNQVLNLVVDMMINGDDEKMILSELCHKHGLKIDNARRNIRNGRVAFKQFLIDHELVEVETIHGMKTKIVRKDLGTVNDPSQERYWSM
jgi:hypothetical protein